MQTPTEILEQFMRGKNVPKMQGFYGVRLEDYSKEDLTKIVQYLFAENQSTLDAWRKEETEQLFKNK